MAVQKVEFEKTFLTRNGADFLFRIPLREGAVTVQLRTRKQRPHILNLGCRVRTDKWFEKDGELETFDGVRIGMRLEELVSGLLLPEFRTISGIERFPTKIVANVIKRFEGPLDRFANPLNIVFEELEHSINGHSKYVISFKRDGKEQNYVFGWSLDPDGKRTHRIILFRAPSKFNALGGGSISLEEGRLSLFGGSEYGYPPFNILHQIARSLAALSAVEINEVCLEGKIRHRFDL